MRKSSTELPSLPSTMSVLAPRLDRVHVWVVPDLHEKRRGSHSPANSLCPVLCVRTMRPLVQGESQKGAIEERKCLVIYPSRCVTRKYTTDKEFPACQTNDMDIPCYQISPKAALCSSLRLIEGRDFISA